MPVGLTPFRVLATESQRFRPTPLARTCSSEIDLLLDVQEVEPEMLHGDNRVDGRVTPLIDSLDESFADEVLD